MSDRILRAPISTWLLGSILLLLTALVPAANAGEIHSMLPDEIDPGAVYLFYAHGKIVEGPEERPSHPKRGTYLFPEIREALVADTDWILIAEHRPRGAGNEIYARKLTARVERLLDAGVPSERIFLIGFSKGGQITTYASNRLAEKGVNTILLGTCAGWAANRPRLTLGGHVLSIHEASDRAKSCRPLSERGKWVKSYTEVEINTGKGHSAFFEPRPEWVDPLKAWIREQLAEKPEPQASNRSGMRAKPWKNALGSRSTPFSSTS
jgi:predicted esterase